MRSRLSSIRLPETIAADLDERISNSSYLANLTIPKKARISPNYCVPNLDCFERLHLVLYILKVVSLILRVVKRALVFFRL